MIIFAARDDTIRLFSLNEKGELDAISQIPVVCEYEDVFPEELPGMPPHRPVEFVIDLEPGMEPVCKCPYKLGQKELKELKKQLDIQERMGLIHLVLLHGVVVFFLSRRRMERNDSTSTTVH